MNDVFIVEPLRTPVGKYGGSLSSVRPDDMAGMVIKALVERTGIAPEAIDDIILGCANQAGEDNRNIARMAGILAGLPYSVPGVTVNRLCASSLEAFIQGARAIRSGEADVMIVGGVESMSRAPYSLPKNSGVTFGNLTAYDTALGWRYPNPAMEKLFPLEAMGETAENVAEKYNISRDDQDIFALQSHEKAVAAQKAGIFSQEIVPVAIPQRKGDPLVITADEQPRADTTTDKLAALKPAFRKGGSVTAGNSSSLNDGAGVALLASEKAIKEYNLQPLARFVASSAAGVDPRYMGIGPTVALPKALQRAKLSVNDLSVVELNEAFAAQALACIRILELQPEIVNPYGGAIAIGHPLGMSGIRILGAVARELHRSGQQYGAASLCIGVGQGLAAIIERI